MAKDTSDRLKRLPPYLFAEIDKARREAIAAGERDAVFPTRVGVNRCKP